MHPSRQLYSSFLDAHVKLHHNLTRKIAFQNGQKAWNEIKKKGEEAIQAEIAQISPKIENESLIVITYSYVMDTKKNSSSLASSSSSTLSESKAACTSSRSSESSVTITSSSTSTTSPATPTQCFKQNNVQNELNSVNEKIVALSNLKATGLWKSENSKELNGLMKTRSQLKQKLNRLKSNQIAQARIRKNRRIRMARLLNSHPELAKEMVSMVRDTPGKPNIEDSQPGLLSTIVDIANCGVVAADNRRRTDAIQSCLTGPTFAAIRSGKHDHSSALGHAKDSDTMVQLPEFEKAALIDGILKPVVIISVDGGPDENPRYPKTIQAATILFKKYNLDALFMVMNAPGRSTFNEV
ncbi:unnamed protein product [Rotaria sp. Silwood1]|nr:unnamed protein product [Rotaria sp. Silwood1]